MNTSLVIILLFLQAPIEGLVERVIDGDTIKVHIGEEVETVRYIGVDTLFVNAELVRQGYAQVSTFPPNVKHVDLFKRLQTEAREANRGLWSIIPPY